MSKVEWTPLVRMRGGEIGRYLGRCIITGKHRVTTYRYHGKPVPPPTGESRDYVPLTWLLDDEGRCRGDLAPSDRDYAGAA